MIHRIHRIYKTELSASTEVCSFYICGSWSGLPFGKIARSVQHGTVAVSTAEVFCKPTLP